MSDVLFGDGREILRDVGDLLDDDGDLLGDSVHGDGFLKKHKKYLFFTKKMLIFWLYICLCRCLFVGQVMFSHHSEQTSQRSQMSKMSLCVPK